MSTTETRGSCTPGELPRVAWHVSSRSNDNGAMCVEAGPVSDASGRVAVRHSRHPEERALVYGGAEWGAFVAGVKHGQFDFHCG